jgi:RimJ/RimL family protein N-acetyltransferase
MTINILSVAESHIVSFHACMDAICREKKFFAKIEAKPLKDFAAWVQEVIISDAIQLVAVDNDTVIGWCDIFVGRSHAIQHRGTLGMGIAAPHRGHGLGTRLLTAGLTRARTQGITRIELEARVDNVAAIKLYEKLGFVHETVKRNGLRYEGVYYDCVQMSLLL